jgi:UDP-glucose 4-epimerase
MRILLTGGAGYIGSHTALSLLLNGYEVTVLDNFSNSSPEAIARVEELAGREVRLIEGDATKPEDLERALDGDPVSAAIHFAGHKAVGESVQKPLAYYANNLDATLRLTEAMIRHGVKAMVFSSSATVYGGEGTMPLSESASRGVCTNPYGWTKWMSEQILTDVAAANPDFHVVLLRYFNPVGAHESGRIGEDPAGIPNNLMPYICQVAAGRLEWLSIYGNDYDTYDGTGVRDYIHVCDLAQGHIAAVGYALSHGGAEIFNLGTGRGYSVLEMVQTFARVNDVRVPYRFTARRPGDVATCYADPSKAKRLLGWKARKTLEDMCRDAWNWQKNNPNGYRFSD